MLRINDDVSIPMDEIELTAIRAQGAGGQNVNKVSSAIHLRFDIRGTASIPDEDKARLLELADQRVSRDGVIVIKSQRFRSQEQNREDALNRLAEWLRAGLKQQKARKPTKPTQASRRKRLDDKVRRGKLKQSRSNADD